MTRARALARLYAVPPRDFTRTRNALAAELSASDPDIAREVARLRRPSPPLWAVNQLGRRAGPALERFLQAVDRLRRTQLSDPRGAMEAMRAERAQLETLVEHAAAALAEAGYTPSADARRRIGDTLLGAAADRGRAAALRGRHLHEELHAPGFDALTGAAGLRVVEGGGSRRNAAERDARRRAAAEARRHERQARAREAEARRREASERAAEVLALERDAAAARERLAEIERRLAETRRAARRPPRRAR
jgi:hypothetical protein